MIRVDRGFVRIDSGLVHYRAAGDDRAQSPVLLLHGGPGSSAGLLPLIETIARDRRVIALDTPGCGDSDPLLDEQAPLADYARALDHVLDALEASHFDVYGHHTGAQIACELAILGAARVHRLILDGAALFPAALQREFQELYAPPVVPVEDGGHLAKAWDFARNLTCYFPHYARDEAHLIPAGRLLPVEAATTIVSEILKVWPTWHRSYRAAFDHDLAARLPLVAAETVVLRVAGDPLAVHAQAVADLLPNARTMDTTREERAQRLAVLLAPKGTRKKRSAIERRGRCPNCAQD